MSATQMRSGQEAVNRWRTRVWCHSSLGLLASGGNTSAAVNPLDTGLTHETVDPLATHTNSVEAQLGVDAGSAVGAP